MKHYDLIVAGGGLTGVSAAVRAAREGLCVLLIEKSGTALKFRPEHFKLVLDDMVCDAGVTVLFHATLFEVKVAERYVKTVRVWVTPSAR